MIKPISLTAKDETDYWRENKNLEAEQILIYCAKGNEVLLWTCIHEAIYMYILSNNLEQTDKKPQ